MSHLTDAGKALVPELVARVEGIDAQFFGRLTQSEGGESFNCYCKDAEGSSAATH